MTKRSHRLTIGVRSNPHIQPILILLITMGLCFALFIGGETLLDYIEGFHVSRQRWALATISVVTILAFLYALFRVFRMGR